MAVIIWSRAGLLTHRGAARTAAGRLVRLFGLRGTAALASKGAPLRAPRHFRPATAPAAAAARRANANAVLILPQIEAGGTAGRVARAKMHRLPSLTLLVSRGCRRSLVPQVHMSDINLTRAPSAGIAAVVVVLFLPRNSPDSFMDGQTGACQRLSAFSLALSCRPPWAASGCMFAAAPSAAAARRASVSGAPGLSWALAKSGADGQTGAVQCRESMPVLLLLLLLLLMRMLSWLTHWCF